MPFAQRTQKAQNGYRLERNTLYRAFGCHQSDRSRGSRRRYGNICHFIIIGYSNQWHDLKRMTIGLHRLSSWYCQTRIRLWTTLHSPQFTATRSISYPMSGNCFQKNPIQFREVILGYQGYFISERFKGLYGSFEAYFSWQNSKQRS